MRADPAGAAHREAAGWDRGASAMRFTQFNVIFHLELGFCVNLTHTNRRASFRAFRFNRRLPGDMPTKSNSSGILEVFAGRAPSVCPFARCRATQFRDFWQILPTLPRFCAGFPAVRARRFTQKRKTPAQGHAAKTRDAPGTRIDPGNALKSEKFARNREIGLHEDVRHPSRRRETGAKLQRVINQHFHKDLRGKGRRYCEPVVGARS